MPFESLDWLFTTVALTLAAVAVLLLYVSLLHDRARGRRRCPKCWYDMAGVPGLQCPECGCAFRSERKLLKTRRRWRWAAAALVVLFAAHAVHRIPRIRQSGPIALVPTTALIAWACYLEPDPRDANDGPTFAALELGRRAARAELADWQWRWLIRDAHVVHTRHTWPASQPWLVRLDTPLWMRRAQLGIVGTSPRAKPTPGNSIIDWTSNAGPLDPAADHVDLTISVMLWGRPAPAAPVWQSLWPVRVRAVASAGQAMQAISTPDLDAAVRQSLDIQMGSPRIRNIMGHNFSLASRLNRANGPIPDEVAIGLKLDVCRDGEVIQTFDLLHAVRHAFTPCDRDGRSCLAPEIQVLPSEIQRWTVRIRGSAEVAIADFERDTHWSGRYEVPLSQLWRTSE